MKIRAVSVTVWPCSRQLPRFSRRQRPRSGSTIRHRARRVFLTASPTAAPAPRTADGKPDLSGVWRGAGPIYRFNIAQDLKPEDIQPWAEALFLKRSETRGRQPPREVPAGERAVPQFFQPDAVVQTPALIVMLYESPNSPHRTIFTDGRDLPKDPNPARLGYSVARWDGDTLVVTGGVQRPGMARQRRASADRIARITERSPARFRPHGFRDHARRSERIHTAGHHQDEAAAGGGHGSPGRLLRKRERRQASVRRHRNQIQPGAGCQLCRGVRARSGTRHRGHGHQRTVSCRA